MINDEDNFFMDDGMGGYVIHDEIPKGFCIKIIKNATESAVITRDGWHRKNAYKAPFGNEDRLALIDGKLAVMLKEGTPARFRKAMADPITGDFIGYRFFDYTGYNVRFNTEYTWDHECRTEDGKTIVTYLSSDYHEVDENGEPIDYWFDYGIEDCYPSC